MKLKIKIYILICIVCIFLNSCDEAVDVAYDSEKTEQDSYNNVNLNFSVGEVIYDKDGVKVTVVAPRGTKVDAYYSLYERPDEEIYQVYCSALVGTISNVREVIVEAGNKKNNMTLYDLYVSEVLYAHDDIQITENDVITIGSGFNSYNIGEGFPIMENGKEFIIYCKKPSDGDDIPISGFVDYLTGVPPIYETERVGDYYLIYRTFANYVGSAFTVSTGMKRNKSETDENDIYLAKKIIESRAVRKLSDSDTMYSDFFLVDCDLFEQAIIKKAKLYLED